MCLPDNVGAVVTQENEVNFQSSWYLVTTEYMSVVVKTVMAVVMVVAVIIMMTTKETINESKGARRDLLSFP